MNDVTTLLQRATDDLTPSRDLVTGAVRTGRRRRRGRLALATAVVVVAGASGAALVSGDLPRSAPIATEALATPGQADVAGELSAALAGRGEVTRPRNWGERSVGGELGFRAGSVLLDGAQVTVVLQHTSEPRCGELPPAAPCTPYGDGYVSAQRIGEAGDDQPTAVAGSSAAYFAPDGSVVTVTASNAPSGWQAEPVMADPVLDVDAVTEIAVDPAWLD